MAPQMDLCPTTFLKKNNKKPFSKLKAAQGPSWCKANSYQCKVYLYRLHTLGSSGLCEGLTISQQLFLDTFRIFIAETIYNLLLLKSVC